MQENKGWICPRCQRVYAFFIQECIKCNKVIEQIEENKKYLQQAILYPPKMPIYKMASPEENENG